MTAGRGFGSVRIEQVREPRRRERRRQTRPPRRILAHVHDGSHQQMGERFPPEQPPLADVVHRQEDQRRQSLPSQHGQGVRQIVPPSVVEGDQAGRVGEQHSARDAVGELVEREHDKATLQHLYVRRERFPIDDHRRVRGGPAPFFRRQHAVVHQPTALRRILIDCRNWSRPTAYSTWAIATLIAYFSRSAVDTTSSRRSECLRTPARRR